MTPIKAVISDFGGVLTSPLTESFASVQQSSGVPLEALGNAMAAIMDRDGSHPLFELETGRRSETQFLDELSDELTGQLGREVSMHDFGHRFFEHLHPNDRMLEFMRGFTDGHFDRVICSRTLEEVPDPGAVIVEALRVAKAVTVGFVNHGYWKNRLDALRYGRKPRNEVYKTAWHESRPANPVSVADFEEFCAEKNIRIARCALLRGDWKTRCTFRPNFFAGYALYDLTH